VPYHCPVITLTATVFKLRASSLTQHLTGFKVRKFVSEVSYKDVKWVELLQDYFWWWAYMTAVLNVRLM
jgi:hypothetical protein